MILKLVSCPRNLSSYKKQVSFLSQMASCVLLSEYLEIPCPDVVSILQKKPLSSHPHHATWLSHRFSGENLAAALQGRGDSREQWQAVNVVFKVCVRGLLRSGKMPGRRRLPSPPRPKSQENLPASKSLQELPFGLNLTSFCPNPETVAKPMWAAQGNIHYVNTNSYSPPPYAHLPLPISDWACVRAPTPVSLIEISDPSYLAQNPDWILFLLSPIPDFLTYPRDFLLETMSTGTSLECCTCYFSF